MDELTGRILEADQRKAIRKGELAAQDPTSVEVHLQCRVCGHNPSVALLDQAGNEYLVCHCTHDDGEVEPVQLHGFDSMLDRWEYVSGGITDNE